MCLEPHLTTAAIGEKSSPVARERKLSTTKDNSAPERRKSLIVKENISVKTKKLSSEGNNLQQLITELLNRVPMPPELLKVNSDKTQSSQNVVSPADTDLEIEAPKDMSKREKRTILKETMEAVLRQVRN